MPVDRPIKTLDCKVNYRRITLRALVSRPRTAASKDRPDPLDIKAY